MKIIFIYKNFIAIRIKGNKGLVFWFHKPVKHFQRCYVDDISILTMREEEGLRYLSEGLDKIIDKTKDKTTFEQKTILSSCRTMMNKMINYYNSEWK